MTAPWVGLQPKRIDKTPRPPTQPIGARLVTGVRASGRRAESVRSVARFTLLGALPTTPLRDRQRLPRTGMQRATTQQDPRGEAVGRAGREPSRRGAVVAGLAHPVDLRHAESVRVQTRWRSSPTAKPPVPPHRRRCRTAPASTARRGRRRPAPAQAPECRRSRCPPVVRADGRHRCPRADGRARRRRRCRRPPGHAAARSLEAVLVARPRPTMSRHPPALPTPAGHRRGRDRAVPASDSCSEPPSSTDDARAARSAASAAFAGHPRRLARWRCARPSASAASSPACATPGNWANGASGSAEAVTAAHASRPLDPTATTLSAHDAPPAERAVTCRRDHGMW